METLKALSARLCCYLDALLISASVVFEGHYFLKIGLISASYCTIGRRPRSSHLAPHIQQLAMMLVLEILPKELIAMVMAFVGEAKSLHLFVFSQELYPHDKRAVYRNLDLVVWNPTAKSTMEATKRGKWPNAANIRKQIDRIALLADTIHESSHLLKKTMTLSIRLSEREPYEMAGTCFGYPAIFYQNSPLACDY